MESILIILALAVVSLIFVLRAMREQHPLPHDQGWLATLASSPYAGCLPDDAKSASSIADGKVAEFVRKCIADHNAMTCHIREEQHFLLPLSLDGDRVVAMPLGLGFRQSKILKLSSIQEPRIDELRPSDENIELIRFAAKHFMPVSISYIDELGTSVKMRNSSHYDKRATS